MTCYSEGQSLGGDDVVALSFASGKPQADRGISRSLHVLSLADLPEYLGSIV